MSEFNSFHQASTTLLPASLVSKGNSGIVVWGLGFRVLAVVGLGWALRFRKFVHELVGGLEEVPHRPWSPGAETCALGLGLEPQ